MKMFRRVSWLTIISYGAMALCILGILFFAQVGYSIACGRMQVIPIDIDGNFSAPTAILEADGSNARGNTMVHSAETIYITAAGDISALSKAAVASMGFLRLLPLIASLALIAILCFKVGRGRVFSRGNTKLILSAAAVMLCASVAVPAINLYCIPAIVNAFGANRIEVGMDRVGNVAYFLYGFVLLFFSTIFRAGEGARKESDSALEKKAVEIQKDA